MRTIEYRATHVPAFLTKLWKLVTDSGSDDLISWSVGGTSFIIYDEIRFAKELLPMYFKHNNMASFVRQLNMYGFRKLSCIEQGGMHSVKHEIEFYHQYFIKDQENLLELIKRKIPSNRSSDDSKIKPEYVKELISSIKSLQGKQQSSEEGMKNLRRENKLLWRQLAHLNTRYMKQQTVLQQVLPLFMNMVQSGQRLPVKRRTALMIHDGENEPKLARIESPCYVENSEAELRSAMTPSPGNVSNRGPVITEMESSKMFTENILCSPNSTTENDVIVDSPLSSLESSEHTMDSPFTDVESMEPLGILNCNFKRLQELGAKCKFCPGISPVTPPTEMLPTGRILTSPRLLAQDMNLSPVESQVRRINSMVPPMSSMSSVPVQVDRSALAAAASVNASSSYAHPPPPVPAETCGEKPMSVMDILNDASHQGVSTVVPPPPPLPPLHPSSSSLSSQMQAIDSILNWMPNGVYESEQNIDYWLGQVFKADNLEPGASLPTQLFKTDNLVPGASLPSQLFKTENVVPGASLPSRVVQNV